MVHFQLDLTSSEFNFRFCAKLILQKIKKKEKIISGLQVCFILLFLDKVLMGFGQDLFSSSPMLQGFHC